MGGGGLAFRFLQKIIALPKFTKTGDEKLLHQKTNSFSIFHFEKKVLQGFKID